MITMAEIMGFIENNSVELFMLVVFTSYILQKAKNDDKRVAEVQQAAIDTTKAVYNDAQERTSFLPAAWNVRKYYGKNRVSVRS